MCYFAGIVIYDAAFISFFHFPPFAGRIAIFLSSMLAGSILFSFLPDDSQQGKRDMGEVSSSHHPIVPETFYESRCFYERLTREMIIVSDY